MACGAYLDDAAFIGHPPVVAAGFVAFRAEVERRGWKCNLTKTLIGLNFYLDAPLSAADLATQRAELQQLFPGCGEPGGIQIVYDGLIFLGTPVGAEQERTPVNTGSMAGNGAAAALDARPLGGDHAGMILGTPEYRQAAVEAYIAEHDARLRRVVELSKRDGRSHTSLAHLSVQLAHLLLRWSCNARDVHLIRGLPRRLVQRAAERHDHSIKVACAAIQGTVTLPPATWPAGPSWPGGPAGDWHGGDVHLYDVPDVAIEKRFRFAYDQICLGFKDGGHGLRPWAQHGDAAFVGQWALSLQSAWSLDLGRSHFPVLHDVTNEAHAAHADTTGAPTVIDNATITPLGYDLACAWERSKNLVADLSTTAPDAATAVGGWLLTTDGDVRNIIKMPEKAQRVVSASVLALQKERWSGRVRVYSAAFRSGGSAQHKNWLAEANSTASLAFQAIPWDEHGRLSITNNAYRTAFARRYRLPLPLLSQGPLRCPCGRHPFANEDARDTIGDHSESTCEWTRGKRTYAHNMLNNVLILFLKAAGFVQVRAEILNWDINAAADSRERRVPDITCYDPTGTTKYIIDTRIAWKLHNDNGSAVGPYTPCKLARDGEREKRKRWERAVRAHRDFTEGAKFVPFSVEIAGGFGPQAKEFVRTVVDWAGNVRDVSVFGWQAATFERYWMQQIGVLLVRERAKVGSAAAMGDWPRRARRANALGGVVAGAV